MDIFPRLAAYTIISEIHKGANSTVYRAQSDSGRTCAIKVFSGQHWNSEHHNHASDLLLRELEVLCTSNHPNLIQLVDFGCTLDTGQEFLSLEWVDGEDFITASKRVNRHEFYSMVAQACRALDYLHRRGIVHGDLKPQNLLVIPNSESAPDAPIVRLIDFGFSTSLGRSSQASLRGSPLYMAPEIIRGAPPTVSSDLYALGIILYECLSGRTPFGGEDVGEILRQHLQSSPNPVSGETMRELHSLVLQLISKDPARRPSSSAEVLRQINTASGEDHFPLLTRDTWRALMSAPPAPLNSEWEVTYRQFIGEAITRQSQSAAHIILLFGDKGSGKTRLLRELAIHARSMGFHTHMLTAPTPDQIQAVSAAAHHSSLTSPTNAGIAICLDNLTPPFIEAIERSLNSIASGTGSCLWALSFDSSIGSGQSRDRISSSLARFGHLISLSLDSFEASDMNSVLRAALGVKHIHPEVADFLLSESGGSPTLLTQLGAAALDQRVMLIDRDTLRLEGDPESLIIPTSLTHELAAQLGTLGEHERHILVLLAVARDRFETIAISQLTGIDALVVQSDCSSLAQRGVLRAHSSAGVHFALCSQAHGRIILSAIPDGTLRALHARLAKWYQCQPATPRILERIVTHVAATGERDETLRHAMIAARDADTRRDYHAAAKYFRLVLSCNPTDQSVLAAASLGHSHALIRLGKLRDATAVLARLTQQCTLPPGLQYEVAMCRSTIADHAGDLLSMEQAARSAYEIASGARMHTKRIKAMSGLGSALCGLQRYAEGMPLLYNTLAKARAHRKTAVVADVLLSIAKCHWMRGNYLQALKYQRRSATATRSCGNATSPVCAEMNIGIVQSDLGLYAKARKTLLHSLQSRPWSKSASGESMVLNNLGETYRAQGRWKLALSHLRRAADASRGSGAHFTAITVDHNEAHVLIGTGHYSAALTKLRHKMPDLRAIGSRQGIGSLYSNWAWLLLATGRLDQGARITAHAIHLAEAADLVSSLLELRTLHAIALLGKGRFQESRLLMRSALADYEGRSPWDARMIAGIAVLQIERAMGLKPRDLEEGLRPLLQQSRQRKMARVTTWALILLGEALLEADRSDEAERDLKEATKMAQKNADRPQFWKASYWLGRVFEQRLQYERALGSYRVAALTVNELAMDIDDDRYREPFLAQPEVREVQARFERLRAEVGRKARHDIASMSRSEKISRRMLNALNAIGQKLTSILDLDDLLTHLLDLSIENVRAERGLVFLRDETTGEMRLACARNMDKESLDEVSSFSRSVIKRVAEGHTLLEVDVGNDPALSTLQSLVIHEIKSILCVPMRTRGKAIGVIYLDTRRAAQMFTDKERAFVESFASQAAIAIENARAFGDISAENARLKREAAGKGRFESLIGTGAAMMKLSETIAGVMGSDCNVLIAGASGTGKELVAKAIHYNGPRQKKKFVAIDCGALPDSLLEAELFGFARGAFTGADRDKPGLIEESHGGTLFLDEITNTSVALQAKLLRVLQEHEVRRLGENSPRLVDARIIAATNADIAALIRDGKFRSDLYYRLNVVTIEVPALRDRREDIPLLVEHFVRQRSADEASRKRLAPGVIEALGRYDWPGNVRELENVVERLLVLARGPVISQDSLPENIRAAAGLQDMAEFARNAALDGGHNGQKNGEHLMVEDALRRFGGDKAKAARFIGWNRQKLYRKMKGFGIPADYGRTV